MDQFEVLPDHVEIHVGEDMAPERWSQKLRVRIDVGHRSVPLRNPEKPERSSWGGQPPAADQCPQCPRNVQESGRSTRIVVGGLFWMIQMSREDDLLFRFLRASDPRHHDIHEIGLEACPDHAGSHDHFLSRFQEIQKPLSLTVGQIEAKCDPATTFR